MKRKRIKPYIPPDVEKYGFRWGPIAVTRAWHDPKLGYCLMIATEHKDLHVYVSAKGQRIRAF